MTITEILNQPDHSRFSIELLPPLKGQHIDSIYRTMDALMPFDPAFVDVTYHREEYVYREVGPGLLQKRTVRKRPGTVGICAALMNRYEIETVPHIICGGVSVEETVNAVIDLDFVGGRNVLALRGTPSAAKAGSRRKPMDTPTPSTSWTRSSTSTRESTSIRTSRTRRRRASASGSPDIRKNTSKPRIQTATCAGSSRKWNTARNTS